MSPAKTPTPRSRRATPPTAPTLPPPRDDGRLALALYDRNFHGASWHAGRVWTMSFYGLGELMTEADIEVFRTCTGRTTPPTRPFPRANTVKGRRSGWSSMLGRFLTPFYAAVREYNLSPGEKGVVQLICPDRRQAGVLLDYAEAGLQEIPLVKIVRRTIDSIELSNGVEIVVQTARFRSVRGYTVLAALVDEAAFLPNDDSADPDVELIRAVLPALATTGGPLILGSSPYAQAGELWRIHDRHFGRDDSDVLCWQAPSLMMNPTLPPRLIEQAIEEDPAGASAEWLAQFRADLESLFGRQALDACVIRGRYELPVVSGHAYVAFLDPSGGSSDSFTLGIAHRDPQGRPVLDLLREIRPPFSPEHVCRTFAADIKRYACRAVFSDSYAAEWPREQFAKIGVTVTPSELTRSELYLELLPMVNSGAVSLLDHPRLLAQLAGLERRTGSSGRDAVDHRRGAMDDVANAAAGALVYAVRTVNVRAALPAHFDACVNFQSSAAKRCPLLMNGGAVFPDDPHCRKHCVGLKAVLPSFREHQIRSAEAKVPSLPASQFLREHFDIDTSPVTRRAAWRKVQEWADHCL